EPLRAGFLKWLDGFFRYAAVYGKHQRRIQAARFTQAVVRAVQQHLAAIARLNPHDHEAGDTCLLDRLQRSVRVKDNADFREVVRCFLNDCTALLHVYETLPMEKDAVATDDRKV